MSDLPSDEIIERAADLWARAILAGDWDNGDGMSRALVQMTRTAPPALPVLVDRFKEALVAQTKARRDIVLLQGGYFDGYLSVDYNPNAPLAAACAVAELPVNLLPCKSHTNLNADHVDVRFGYGARSQNHYPLGDGRWLVTDLYGDEMSIILQAVNDGRLPELTVEP